MKYIDDRVYIDRDRYRFYYVQRRDMRVCIGISEFKNGFGLNYFYIFVAFDDLSDDPTYFMQINFCGL